MLIAGDGWEGVGVVVRLCGPSDLGVSKERATISGYGYMYVCMYSK